MSSPANLVFKTVEALQAMHPRATATLDVDATIIGAHKELALRAYEGTLVYQPQMALWADGAPVATRPGGESMPDPERAAPGDYGPALATHVPP